MHILIENGYEKKWVKDENNSKAHMKKNQDNDPKPEALNLIFKTNFIPIQVMWTMEETRWLPTN
jgi:hypothetical protein